MQHQTVRNLFHYGSELSSNSVREEAKAEITRNKENFVVFPSAQVSFNKYYVLVPLALAYTDLSCK